MGLMLALMQLSALSLWGMWCYQAGPFVSETAALLDRWMEVGGQAVLGRQ